MHDCSIGMTGEVEVSRNSVNLEVPLDPTPFLLVYVLNHSVELLILTHVLVRVNVAIWDDCLLE